MILGSPEQGLEACLGLELKLLTLNGPYIWYLERSPGVGDSGCMRAG